MSIEHFLFFGASTEKGTMIHPKNAINGNDSLLSARSGEMVVPFFLFRFFSIWFTILSDSRQF